MRSRTAKRMLLLIILVGGAVIQPADGGTPVDVDAMPDVNATAPQTVYDAVYSYLADFVLPEDRSESRWLSPDSCNQLRFIPKVVANDSFALGIECDGDDRRPVSCVT